MTEIWDIKATIAVSVGFVLSRSLSGLAIGIFKCAKTADFFTHLRVPHTKNDCDCYDFVYCFVRCDALFTGVYGLGTICSAVISFLWYRHVAYSKFGRITGDIAEIFWAVYGVLCVIFGGVLCVLL